MDGLTLDVYGDRADAFFENEPSRGRVLFLAETGEHRCGAYGGVAGKGQFAAGREDPDPAGVGGVVRWQHEGGLGEVELPGQVLHRSVGQAFSVGDDGQLIPAEGPVAEHVDQNEAEISHQPTIASISTAAPSGRAATPMAVRAG